MREKLAGLKEREVGQRTITAHQLSGVDVQWHRWLESRQIAINTELSRCMVQKDAARKIVKTEFGRCQSSEMIAQEVKAEKAKHNRIRNEQCILSLMIHTDFPHKIG